MYFTKSNFLPLLVFIAWLSGCTPRTPLAKSTHHPKSDISLNLLDVYTIPYNLKFQETVVGGLSGIDYDKNTGKYYIISDERSATSPSRFYTAHIKISGNKINRVEFLETYPLTNSQGNVFPSLKEDPVNAADPESMRFNPVKNTLIWTDEGDKANRNGSLVLRNPFIYETDLQGHYKDSFYLPENMWMHQQEKGPRTNGVFEGSAFDGAYKYLYVSVEEPLFEDGPRADVDVANAPIRIIKFDVTSRKPVAQYAYLLDAVARQPFPRDAFRVNGVSEILWLEDEKLLVMERSFSMGRLGCTIKLYVADLKDATDVSTLYSLKDKNAYKAAPKKLLLNMDSLNQHIDNVEGITFGPVLPNGRPSVICIADNNFQSLQKQQVFLFEVLL